MRHSHPTEDEMHTDASSPSSSSAEGGTISCTKDVGVNTGRDDRSRMEHRIQEVERKVSELKAGQNVAFRLESLKSDDSKVAFYTGFPSYAHLKACFDFFGPAAMNLRTRTHPQCLKRGKGWEGHVPFHLWRNFS